MKLGFTRVTSENKDALAEGMLGIYKDEGCGICQKWGAEVFWFTPYSRVAHRVCYEKIKPIEADLVRAIQTLFVGEIDHFKENRAHTAALSAIKKEFPQVTIATFLQTYGAERLRSIFNTAGINAVKVYASPSVGTSVKNTPTRNAPRSSRAASAASSDHPIVKPRRLEIAGKKPIGPKS